MSVFESAAKARDRALESAVFSFLHGLAGDYIELEREGVRFDFSKGHVSFSKMEFKEAVKQLVDQQLARQGLKVRMAHGCLHRIELTEFYPQDVLDGDFDYPLSAKVDGLVLVLEPTEELGEPAPPVEEQPAEQEPTKNNMLLETFLQGFGHIEITKIHIRYQDPQKKINIALDVGMGDYGAIRVWEPAQAPKSFRSVDKENEDKEKPLQDVVKQFFIPFPSIEINPKADRMIGSEYAFEPQPKSCAIIQEGSLLTCSLALDSRKLGQDITIFDPQLRDPLVFNLSRTQVEILLDVAKHLKPKELTENPDILIGADVLDHLGITISGVQLEHFLMEKQMAQALPEDKPGFYLHRAARIKIHPQAIHAEGSFRAVSDKSFRVQPARLQQDSIPAPADTTSFESPSSSKEHKSKITARKEKTGLWHRFKNALSCKNSKSTSVALQGNDSADATSMHSCQDEDRNFTHALGENALVVPVQLKQSWGGSFNGLEINIGP